LNSEDGIKPTLIALKNNISMKEQIMKIEKDSNQEGKNFNLNFNQTKI